jgi:DNA-binding transcriptional LysR family regulator
MRLFRLRYFVAVAEELNFTRAAEKLHVAQPALSRQIQQLENEIGVELFTRDRRHVLLTLAGRALLDEARTVIAHYALAVQRARDAGTKVLNVGIGFGLGAQVNRVFSRHARTFPSVQLRPKNIPSTLQNSALRRFEIDIGFLRAPVDHEHLNSQLIFKEPFFVLLPETSPIAHYKKVRLRQLTSMTLLLPPRNRSTGVYDRVLDLYKRLQITPNVKHTPDVGPYEEAGCMLVASGQGIYISCGTLAREPVFRKGVRVLRLHEAGASVDVYAAWRNYENSEEVSDFLATVREVFRNKEAVS